jgi:deoxyribodipyrimidine photo-lyase
MPKADPFLGVELPRLDALASEIKVRWGEGLKLLGTPAETLAHLPIDHSVKPVSLFRGGKRAARARLREFLQQKLSRYPEDRNHPARDATSGLSAYFHFGYLSIHEVFREIAALEGWIPERRSVLSPGSRTGWWGMSPAAEAFLDQAVTWRELGFHFCRAHPQNYDRFESLPAWAREILIRHQRDRLPGRYGLERLLAAQSEDRI